MSDWVVDLQTQNCSHSWLSFMVSTPAMAGHACWCFWGCGGGAGRGGTFICTSTQCMSLYGTVRSLALSNIRHATLLCKKTSHATSSTNLAKFVVEQEGPGSRNDNFVVVKCVVFQFWGNLSIENGPHLWWKGQWTFANCHSFGHLTDHNAHSVTHRCHHRHGLLQTLIPHSFIRWFLGRATK